MELANLSQDKIEHQKDLTLLIAARKWKELHEVLSGSSQNISDLRSAKCYPSCCRRHSLLHLACQFDPPLSIVKSLDKVCKGGVFESDCKNRCPLHIALMYGTSYEVVEYLLKRNKTAAFIADIEGKTLLHLAFHGYSLRNEFGVEETESYLFPTIQLLCEAFPLSTLK